MSFKFLSATSLGNQTIKIPGKYLVCIQICQNPSILYITLLSNQHLMGTLMYSDIVLSLSRE